VLELQELVAAAPHLRALGTRHSFSAVADSPGVLVSLDRLAPDVTIDPVGMTATVTARTTYGVLADRLETQGFALHNMGSLPHISLGGAIATGTHGSGSTLGSLSTAVHSFEVLGPDGAARTIDRDDPSFPGSVLHLGLLGIVTRVTLDVEPTYGMRQDSYGPVPWDVFTANVAAIHAAATSVCSYTVFGDEISEVLLKSRVPDGAEDVAVPEELFGASKLPGSPGDGHHTARDGSVGPWWDRLPHFPIESVPSHGSEVQSEHFVPLRHAAAALDALRGLADRIQPHLHVCELRTMAADELWLSPTQGEDVLCIAFTWQKHPEAVAALLPDLEARLAPFDGRPHWGKMSSLDGDAIAELYPRVADVRDLIARADPDRTFASAFGERVLRA
jgi:xylitol oxidase